MATKKTTTKRKRSGKQKSSSSGKTVASRTATDVLELGKNLVIELKLEERRDTLARWLAHHVAELISDAERAADPIVKKETADSAVETILKIWDHRANLPGNANPLAPYRNILEVLSGLNPGPNHWHTYSRDQRITGLHHGFSRLMRALLLLEYRKAGGGGRAIPKIVRKFLQTDQRRLLSLLEMRLNLNDQPPAKKAHQQPPDEYRELQKLANKLIDQTIADLTALRKEAASGQSAPAAVRPK